MHARRWLTALILLPILFLALFKGGHFFFILLLLVINGLAEWEFLGMFQPDVDTPRRVKAIILGSVLLLSFCTAQRATTLCNPSGPLFVLVGILFVLFLFYLVAYSHLADLSRDLMANVLALLYIPFLLGHFIWLRYLNDGQWWVFWLLVVIMAADTGAFYCGRAFGKTKLYPEVSPGKTWAGTVGGTLAAVLVGVALGRWALPGLSLPALGGLALLLALVGQLGDLFESMLKRQAQVKDASEILPGHGGMLDRLDSLLFAAPALVYARLFFLG
ncbi:MAG: phosphatidate cytidylyltransferase [Syntrophobacterales bacterium]|nr:phosphatidate cytidylyltransferase [Syntrophobacterales bacterium]